MPETELTSRDEPDGDPLLGPLRQFCKGSRLPFVRRRPRLTPPPGGGEGRRSVPGHHKRRTPLASAIPLDVDLRLSFVYTAGPLTPSPPKRSLPPVCPVPRHPVLFIWSGEVAPRCTPRGGDPRSFRGLSTPYLSVVRVWGRVEPSSPLLYLGTRHPLDSRSRGTVVD